VICDCLRIICFNAALTKTLDYHRTNNMNSQLKKGQSKITKDPMDQPQPNAKSDLSRVKEFLFKSIHLSSLAE
jgi:hypothetical protein